MSRVNTVPAHANACLMLADGDVFFGKGLGAPGEACGEICFNTGMTGYQEVLTDPSYAGQIITFTFPHMGNTGTNAEDIEALTPYCAGLVLREDITLPSSFRADSHFNEWLQTSKLTGICGLDTRALTRRIREKGAQNAVIHYLAEGESFDFDAIKETLAKAPSMKGRELASIVAAKDNYQWKQKRWKLGHGYCDMDKGQYHVVAIDYGEKLNILRSLCEMDCQVTVVPAKTSASEILKLNPDGVFLSNGPGDPAATSDYAVPVLKELIEKNVPIFGICLGHQLLALALGCSTGKMHQGHRGANHPVKNLLTGAVEITSQNHGFCVEKDSLPKNVEQTHVSLFDECLEGIRHTSKPVFSVQYHPESSPGPHDSLYLFKQFIDMMKKEGKAA